MASKAKNRVGMMVEFVGVLDVRRPDGYISRETAALLGIAADAGWRMTNVETLIGPNGPGKTKVELFRDVPVEGKSEGGVLVPADEFTGEIDSEGKAISARVKSPCATCEVDLQVGGFGALAAGVDEKTPYCTMAVYPNDSIMPPVAYLTDEHAVRRLAEVLNSAADKIEKYNSGSSNFGAGGGGGGGPARGFSGGGLVTARVTCPHCNRPIGVTAAAGGGAKIP